MVGEDVFVEQRAEHHGAHEDGEDEAEGEVWFVRMVEMRGKKREVPSVRPESLCESFRAGNLKKIKMYMEPSKMLAVTPRTRRRLSETVSCELEY
jgi:hypothetical protein